MVTLRLLTLLMACAVSAVAADAAEQRARVGKAYDAESGVLLYVERHLETVVNGRVVSDDVTYVDANGQLFARKRVEFGARPQVPEFRLDDQRTGHVEALSRVEGNLVEVRFRERGDEPLQSARLAAPEDALADAGFDRFIEERWDELLAGTTFVRRFLVPSRLDFMDFRIRRAAPREAEGRIGFVLEVDSALLRLVVPSIVAVYDSTARRLLHYEGLSNLRSKDGDNLRVRIDFDYATRVAGVDGCEAACVR